MVRRLAPIMGLWMWLLAGLAIAVFPAVARAQVNIDQGISPAEIYASDCATCHKSPRGLAVGKNSSTLSSFLREHYTASREQAAALAAYVLGAGGNEPAPVAARQKPKSERAKAGEPKAGEPKAGEPKTGEPKFEAHPTRKSAKPEEEAPATAKLQRPEEEARPEERGKHEPRPVTASRGEKRQPEETPAHEAVPAAPAVTIPAAQETPSPAETPNSAASRKSARPQAPRSRRSPSRARMRPYRATTSRIDRAGPATPAMRVDPVSALPPPLIFRPLRHYRPEAKLRRPRARRTIRRPR